VSKIFELYGHRLDRWDKAAETNLRRVGCPFMNGECDGGGNRYLSTINLKGNAMLQDRIPNKAVIQCGVCSLQIREGEQPWIVCPRRLLSLKNGNLSEYQALIRRRIAEYSALEPSKAYKAWSEVKIKREVSNEEDKMKTFDYAFDYVIAAIGRKTVNEGAALLSQTPEATKKIAEKNGFTVAMRNGEYWIDDFPTDPLIIIEVMTSSTSGGNKKKRTQIAMACEDAILHGMKHNAPGINYRQVWARMVSQLIVKSQVALAWNSKTIWLVQDVLADYISKSTALILPEYLAARLDEVNILSASYGNTIAERTSGVIKLQETQLFAGPIATGETGGKAKGFIDIIKIGAPPPKAQMWRALLNKAPLGNWA
jgi:Skp family chaperone for outer membrane proteins